MSDRLKRTQDFINKVNKAYGEGTAGIAARVPRISTGILSLDLALNGGAPRGRSMLLVGPESSGKTYLAHSTQAQFNLTNWETGEIDPTYKNPTATCWIDTEGTMDPRWAGRIGVLNDSSVNVHIIPETAEAAFDIAYDCFCSGQFGLVVLDSVEASVVAEEMDKSFEEHVIGKKAILVNKLFRKVTAACNRETIRYRNGQIPKHKVPMFIAINQPREKVGVLFGDPSTLPGGKGQLFMSSVIITMHSPSVTDTSKKEGGQVAIKGVVKKNKTGMPKEVFNFDLAIKDQGPDWPSGKVNNAKSLMPYVKERLMSGTTGKYQVFDRDYKKQEDIITDLQTDLAFYEKCREEIVSQVLELGKDDDEGTETT